MRTEVIKQECSCMNEEELKRAGAVIRNGGLVAFPTETVYGLGGDALNPESSKKIYAAKGRPSDNPLIVHICCMEDLDPLVSEIPEAAVKLAEAFWPGPLTMVLPKSQLVPKETTGGLDTVAVRMPSHEVAKAFIREAGGYVECMFHEGLPLDRPFGVIAANTKENFEKLRGIVYEEVPELLY